MDPVSFYIAAQLCMAHVHHRGWSDERYYDEGYESCEVIRRESFSSQGEEGRKAFINRLVAEIEKRKAEVTTK